MVTLKLSFPANRYHGTRWGTHVNEADIDWPPSPWRILRALLSVGFTRFHWEQPLIGDVHTMLEKLASANVHYGLPKGAVSSHTRHYMRQFKEGDTAKLFDAFLHFPSDAKLFVRFETELTEEEESVLAACVEQLSYLGRAESWVDAELSSEGSEDHLWCSTSTPSEGSSDEPIRLLCAIPSTDYEVWRTSMVASERARLLQVAVEKALSSGKKPPLKLSKAKEREAIASVPTNIVHALMANTNLLRKKGWNRPPGSIERIYWRPVGAVGLAASRRVQHSRDRSVPTMALLQLSSDTVAGTVLPRLKDAIDVAGKLHGWLVSQATKAEHLKGADLLAVTGRDGSNTAQGHQHAHLLPLAMGGYSESRPAFSPVDHILVWIPSGITQPLQRLLLSPIKLYSKQSTQSVRCVGFASPRQLAKEVVYVGESKVWRSVTPFLPPRYVKKRGKNSLRGQIEAEFVQRGFSCPSRIEVRTADGWSDLDELEDRPDPVWRHFRVQRSRGGQKAKQRLRYGLRVHFEQPQRGPLAIGFGSHFGLGLFAPVEQS